MIQKVSCQLMILDIVITQRLKHQREQELDYPGNRSQN